jgi:phosphoribosylformylglycinamidine synthase
MISIIQFLGTNCEYDTIKAYENLGYKTKLIWHEDKKIPSNTDLIVLPGGFSYGDYLRSGAIAKFANIMEAVISFANKGGNVLGICNGFQILTELKLLDGALINNQNLKFISKFQTIKAVNTNNKFLKNINKDKPLNIPIAHADGNFVCKKDTLKSMFDNEQILLKYCDKDGNDFNVNGSVDNIAGICNKNKNIFGLMPHPERATNDILGSKDGLCMLDGFFK